MLEYNNKKYVCHLDLGMDLIRGKWKAVILCHLNKGPKRFLELQKITCGVSQKVLNEKLTELEYNGLISKKAYPQVPPKVEYSLTNKGKELFPALDLLEKWSVKYFSDL
ncbi:winged helix-turn-helix transcriptional regulator [Tepidibacter hydrothermalis]|uniref:Helix-turn-helix domain-containing protein n=1 Tax=Tepidibacter hydrothermalis TaxID=3036126 RepID=A0ABY8EG87_9FIRM|nr:helix-turn-helix domain-containing protein [Tepidibacter hydrothermalis]WFD11951.1 helix-turn-helix domain-containing protein [Tepidibacter hydrothermalis]